MANARHTRQTRATRRRSSIPSQAQVIIHTSGGKRSDKDIEAKRLRFRCTIMVLVIDVDETAALASSAPDVASYVVTPESPAWLSISVDSTHRVNSVPTSCRRGRLKKQTNLATSSDNLLQSGTSANSFSLRATSIPRSSLSQPFSRYLCNEALLCRPTSGLESLTLTKRVEQPAMACEPHVHLGLLLLRSL